MKDRESRKMKQKYKDILEMGLEAKIMLLRLSHYLRGGLLHQPPP